MTSFPTVWSDSALANAADTSAAAFRAERLGASDAWQAQFDDAHRKFEQLLVVLGDLRPGAVTDAKLVRAFGLGLGETLRYLAGPPISEDDLQVIAEVESLAPGVLKRKPQLARRVYEVIARIIDPNRFPWLGVDKAPTPQQRKAALLASSVLLAAQRLATLRRNEGKQSQESKVMAYLTCLGFKRAPACAIQTTVKGPQHGEFFSECLLGDRKADIVVRLPDTRLLAIECKVSNSATNSVKRLNNDAAVKAEYWIKQFGTRQVVPIAVLAGVFKVLNLQQAQERGLSLIWSHDLDQLGSFIRSTA